MVAGHGGNVWQTARTLGVRPDELLDFSASINPLGQPSALRRVLLDQLGLLQHYPDPDGDQAMAALETFTGLQRSQLVLGNGTSALLFALTRELACSRALIVSPGYIDYRTASSRAGLEICCMVLGEEQGFCLDTRRLARVCRPGDLVFIGQPNNPTGTMVERCRLLELCAAHPRTWFVVDEAFAGFVEQYSSVAGELANIIVLASLTKLYAIPGLRLGYLAGPEQVCSAVRRQLAPWSVNTLAQAAVVTCLADRDFQHRSVVRVRKLREQLEAGLDRLQLFTRFPSSANFVLLKLRAGKGTAAALAARLLDHARIMIRPCADYDGLDGRFVRVAVRTEAENHQLLEALAALNATPAPPRAGITGRGARRRTPAVMLQGTGSDVGKSVLAAGLCRVLLQDGLRVAPFKAQNMSLNSFVTLDGGEMGRAQVVQAQACRLEPDVRMNPVLLKPSTDTGSQVIVLGRPVGNMSVREYFRYKPTIWQRIRATYDELASEADCMVLEGAGSAGEVNLMRDDIVNMPMARHAGAAVLLVGDIDRGGVYAAFIGHHQVLSKADQSLLGGFIVNRFRGAASLLAEAHAYLDAATGVPVLGVVEYLDNLDLPQEDSVNFKRGVFDQERPTGRHVEIALIDLPHIANCTDATPLGNEPDVWLRRICRVEELERPAAVLLPGSKNVIADLAYLQTSGLAARIRELAGSACEIVGICGGYQMLGQRIEDPHGIEGEPGRWCEGLGLLDITTALGREKQLVRREGVHCASGTRVTGYEIHHGVSSGGAAPLFMFAQGAACGSADAEERIWGAYLHGMFDSDAFRHHFIERLRQRQGLLRFDRPRPGYDIEPALDRLADVLRQRLDLAKIYALMGL
ncbi:MAG: threonine-phosphate decarboxylase [Desulfobulbus propionicus]|nr:MAG: threonine-phosphate decarboxylase [Desulfobulbus propionicus]